MLKLRSCKILPRVQISYKGIVLMVEKKDNLSATSCQPDTLTEK